LRNAFGYLNAKQSTRSRCQILLATIKKFMFDTLRSYSGDDPDPVWPLIEVEIFYALRCRLGFPDLRMLIHIVGVKS